MDYVMLILRLTHIFAGVVWVGATLMMHFYVGPSTDATGEAGQQVLRHLIAKGRFTTVMTVAGMLTVLAGYAMYWRDSDGFSSAWTHSGPGIGFAIGGAAGLFGLIFRILANRYMAALGRLTAGLTGQPGQEQSQKLVSLQKNQALLNMLSTWALIIAVLFMATARYLVF
ncbi:MAG: hypothetical protein L0287_25865 [Anaerolineae bacterium]|nr:hypothetical protein [Anaerolineae bacterium]